MFNLIQQQSLNGKDIHLFNEEMVSFSMNRNYHTVAAKIKSLVKAMIFFTSGICLKAYVWTRDFSYVRRRNRRIFELTKKGFDFKQQCDPQSYAIRPRHFQKPAVEQQQSQFQQLPKDLKFHAFSFLSPKDIASFAFTCKKNHRLATDFLAKPANQGKDYPQLIVQALGKEKLSQLPLSVLPEAWQILFKNIERWSDDLEQENFNIGFAEAVLICQTFDAFIREKLSSLMKNHAIQRIQLPEGPALIIRVKDNLLNQEQSFVIAKVKEKWMVVTRHLSSGMWLFLNDLRFHQEAPNLVDYLRRLFNGEPCGNFPQALNANFDVRYSQGRASDLLQEGPRLCPNGKPVIQLWSP